MGNKPNIIVILNDDMGYSDIGCYGGEARTPVLDRLAANGIRLSQFYNTPRCSPTRASLLTGLHPHQVGVGILTDNQLPDGYEGDLSHNSVTIAEVLKTGGYATYMSGKWHVCNDWFEDKNNWPRQRGFDKFYGIIAGAGDYYHPNTLTRDNENIEHEAKENANYYLTDAISDNAVDYITQHDEEAPFFLYLAYTASHWPLHAFEEDIAEYSGRFDAGWDRLREERLERMINLGLIDPAWKLTPRDETQPAWEDAEHKEWEARRMEVYAAQIDRMDRGIGKIIRTLEERNMLENTLILFLADNGACAEVLTAESRKFLIEAPIAREYTKDGTEVRFGNDPAVMPGDENSYQSYGIAWANLSNTPFRLYKHWTHEGGIATPFIAHWPAGIQEKGAIYHSPAQLTDIMATILEVSGCTYPREYEDRPIPPCEGESLTPFFRDGNRRRGMLFWEHEGNAAVRDGKWKLVKKYPEHWELYDLDEDRTELNNLVPIHPERTKAMQQAYAEWAERCGVIPREVILNL